MFCRRPFRSTHEFEWCIPWNVLSSSITVGVQYLSWHLQISTDVLWSLSVGIGWASHPHFSPPVPVAEKPRAPTQQLMLPPPNFSAGMIVVSCWAVPTVCQAVFGVLSKGFSFCLKSIWTLFPCTHSPLSTKCQVAGQMTCTQSGFSPTNLLLINGVLLRWSGLSGWPCNLYRGLLSFCHTSHWVLGHGQVPSWLVTQFDLTANYKLSRWFQTSWISQLLRPLFSWEHSKF